jgi:hypothetical protein
MLPKVSREMLAEMIGTTRSRVNFFMNKFRNLGFIEYNGGIHQQCPPECCPARLSKFPPVIPSLPNEWQLIPTDSVHN